MDSKGRQKLSQPRKKALRSWVHGWNVLCVLAGLEVYPLECASRPLKEVDS